MEVNYFPGCTLHGTAHDYDESVRAALGALGVRLFELEDWNCCGASSAHVLNPEAAWKLPARNLVISSKSSRPLLAPCAACFHRLAQCRDHLRRRPGDHPLTDKLVEIDLISMDGILTRPDVLARLRDGVKRPLHGLKAIPYYGCLTARPPGVTGHPAHEDPQEMDIALEAMGADVVTWSYKTDCCGGSHAMTRPDIVRQLSGKLFEAAQEAGGQVIVCSCPMCQANLDVRQREIEAETGARFDIPIMYVTELVAVAMGISDGLAWRRKHFVDPAPALRAVGVAS